MKTTRFFDGAIAAVLALGVTTLMAIGDPAGQDIPIPDYDCVDGDECRAAPTCPNLPSGECDSCTAYTHHDICSPEIDDTCILMPAEVRGCGFKREGTCDANNDCIYTVSSDRCKRLRCR